MYFEPSGCPSLPAPLMRHEVLGKENQDKSQGYETLFCGKTTHGGYVKIKAGGVSGGVPGDTKRGPKGHNRSMNLADMQWIR